MDKLSRKTTILVWSLKGIKWFLGQIIMALIIAGAVGLATIHVNNELSYGEENRILQQIGIGVSKEFITKNLGAPRVVFKDQYQLENAYYPLKYSNYDFMNEYI